VAALFVLLALTGPLTGCATKGANSWTAERDLVIETIERTQVDQTTQQKKIEAMEQRISELEKNLKEQEAERNALEADVRSLRKHSASRKIISTTSTKDKKLARKLEKIESSIRSATSKGAPVIQPSDKSIEKNSYTAAYLSLKSGRYEEAAVGFKSLIHDHPKGEYADQAYFWLGESYFAQRKFNEAITAFTKVANNYPDSAKHPAALLKLASAYQEAGRKGDAKAVLQRLIQQHAESNAAEQARAQLSQLEQKK